MSNANEAVVRYLAAWNEPEAKRRRELVAKAWTDDGTYVDAAREGRGHDSLDAMIATDFDPATCTRKMVTVWYAFWGETRWKANFLRLCARWSQAYQRQTRARMRVDSLSRLRGRDGEGAAESAMSHRPRPNAPPLPPYPPPQAREGFN